MTHDDHRTNARASTLLVVSFLAVAGIVYSFMWPQAPVQTTDSAQYMEAAHDLHDFHIDELNDRPPGYPLLLLLTGSSEHPTRALYHVQLTLHLVSVLLLALMLLRTGVGGRITAVFAVIACLPGSVAHCGYVLTESLSELCLVAATFLLISFHNRRGVARLVAAGLFAAAAAMVRPTYQLLGLALGAALLLGAFRPGSARRPLFGAAVIMAVLPTLLVGALAIYNLHAFGYFGLTPLGGFNLSTRTVRVLERLPDEYAPVRRVLIRHRDAALVSPGSSHTADMYIWQAIPDLEAATGLDRVELSKYMLKVNLLLIRRAPLEYLLEVGRAAASYWMPAGPVLANFGSRPLQLIWGLLHFAVVIVFFGVVAALFGCSLRDGTRSTALDPRFLIPTALIAYTMVISVAFEVGAPRYRVPTDLLILFVAAAGVRALTSFNATTPPVQPEPGALPPI